MEDRRMNTYTTISGDAWDQIARKVYGDELKADHLLKDRRNIDLLDYEIFPAGIVVAVPELAPEQQYADDLPDWRRDT